MWGYTKFNYIGFLDYYFIIAIDLYSKYSYYNNNYIFIIYILINFVDILLYFIIMFNRVPLILRWSLY